MPCLACVIRWQRQPRDSGLPRPCPPCRGADLQRAVQCPEPLAQSGQAISPRSAGLHAAAIVGHIQHHLGCQQPDADRDPPWPAMAHGIVDQFLNGAVDRDGIIIGQAVDGGVKREAAFNARLPELEQIDAMLDRDLEAEGVQRRRAQAADQRAHGAVQPIYEALRLGREPGGAGPDPVGKQPGIDADGREQLSELIVQLPRDNAAMVFMLTGQFAGQPLYLHVLLAERLGALRDPPRKPGPLLRQGLQCLFSTQLAQITADTYFAALPPHKRRTENGERRTENERN